MASVTGQNDQAPMKTDQKVKITLYWLEKSRSQRILWLLEELRTPYSLKTFKRVNILAPRELKDIHPLGKSPVVTVEPSSSSSSSNGAEARPLVLAESGAIVEYLIEHFGTWLAPERYEGGGEGKGKERETEGWFRYRYFLHYAEGSLMPLLLVALVFQSLKSQSPFFLKPVVLMITGAVESKFLGPSLNTHFDFLETQIATSPDNGDFLCGRELSGADIMMSFPLRAAKGRSTFSKERHPKLWAYVERLEAMEGYKRAVQKIVDVEGRYDPSL